LSTLTLTHLRMEKRLTRLLDQFYGERRVQFGLSMILGANILVPDVLVLAGDRPVLHRGILNELPLLCVEVLSPPRQTEAVLARCARYRNAGIPFSWVVDTAGRKAWEYAAPQQAAREVTKMFSGPCQLRLRDIFAE
jgi:Uma2 family endonuclease